MKQLTLLRHSHETNVILSLLYNSGVHIKMMHVRKLSCAHKCFVGNAGMENWKTAKTSKTSKTSKRKPTLVYVLTLFKSLIDYMQQTL